MKATSLMPAAFVGHGSPMNAIETNRYTDAWQRFGQSVPRPRAILVVSAHWYINATAVTAMPRPRTIHDFYGFPQELFDILYPAPGLPGLAEESSDIVQPTWVGADADSWYDWAQRFDEASAAQIADSPADVATLDAHPDYSLAVPTPDHFIPFLYFAGIASAGTDSIDTLISGFSFGSLSMTAYTLGHRDR